MLVTIDGMRGDYLGEADRYQLKIPTLRRLIAGGAFSAHTVSVFPTLTGTAHTALVTGVGAARHGILGNNRFSPEVWTYDRDNYDFQPTYRDFSHVRARTLWTAAREQGLKTAAVGWPQTAGGPIDYRLDVTMAATAAESHARIAGAASPGWLDQVEQTLGPIAAVDLRMVDHMKALVAGQILKRFHPALIAVHFSLTDSVQHEQGPGTPAALAALEDTDHNLDALLDGVRVAGLEPSTLVIVTGDHGFLAMHTELAINLPLVDAGLITKGPDGAPRWQAIVAPNRGLGSLYVKADAPTGTREKARAALEGYARRFPGRFRIVERDELTRWGADADAVIGVEPVPGYVLDARLTAPFAQAHLRAAGHGYRPDVPEMHTGLIVAGPAARAGARLAETRTVDVAPTIAQVLGLSLPDVDGSPIVGALRR